MRAKVERWFPLFNGAVAGVTFYYLKLSLTVAPVICWIASIVLFILALFVFSYIPSVLTKHKQSYIIKQLKASNTYDKLINYCTDAVLWSFASSLIDSSNYPLIWVVLFVIALSSCYRITSLLLSIVRLLD